MKKTPDDIILDKYAETQAYINRFEFSSADNFAKSLENIVEGLADRIKYLEKSKKPQDRPKKAKLKKLYAQSVDELAVVYENLREDLKQDMETAGKVAYKGTAAAFKEALDIDALTFDRLPIEAIAEWSDLSMEIELQAYDKKRIYIPEEQIKKLFGNQKKDFRRSINRALAEGLGIDEAVRQFRFDSGKLNGITNAQMRALTRTTIAESMTRAKAYSEDTNFSDVINGYQWISILDSRTTVYCAALAGTIKRNRKDFDELPPIHFSCRSLVCPLTDFSDRENLRMRTRTFDEVLTTDPDGETRTRFDLASDKVMNIKLPDQRTKFNAFDVWFKQLPQKRQVQWLGPEKYKLYQTGKIGMKSLVDGEGKIRSVKELAKMIGLDEEGLKEIKRRDIPAYKPKDLRKEKK